MTTKNIVISNQTYPIVTYKGSPVITFAMIDKMHGRVKGTARKRFNDHKTRFQEEKHFYLVNFSEKSVLRTFGIEVPARGLMVLTERGYLLLSKSLTDELAWQIQETLSDLYFAVKDNERKENCPAPLTQNHQLKLSEAVNERADQSAFTRQELLFKLRDHYEVSSWLKINDAEYYNAVALIRTWVFSENEQLPAPVAKDDTNNLMIQLRDHAKEKLGLPHIGYMNIEQASKYILDKIGTGEDSQTEQAKEQAKDIASRVNQIKALILAAQIGFNHLSINAKKDYAYAVASLSGDLHCSVDELSLA